MAQPYVGEIRMFGGNFAPAGWAFCQGQLLPISENETLYQLIGTTYGGDGNQTFGLPNLASRTPVHFGQGPSLPNYVLAQSGGVESVTLNTSQMAAHTHVMSATNASQTASPSNAYPATVASSQAGVFAYDAGVADTPLAPAVSVQGGNQPHDNIQPSLGLSFIISLFGIYPSN